MSLELDHLFIWTSPGAPEIERLLELGFVEGRGNIHRGQGTACRCIFFQNAYLEFLWIEDEVAAQSDLVRPLQLRERAHWKETGASPFGIGLRSASPPGGMVRTLPFPTWEYRPLHYPPDLHLNIAKDSDSLTEPLIFYSQQGLRPDSWPAERMQPTRQPAGLSEIANLAITSPAFSKFSKTRSVLEATEIVNFRTNHGQVAEVKFGETTEEKHIDFRPDLPLWFCR